jgi:predicted ribosomally synthesized peptide with nif11-like leader
MSKQAASDFLSKVDSDPTISHQVMKSVDDVVKLGAKNGYNFSNDDLKQALAEKWAPSPTPRGGGHGIAYYCTIIEK